MSKFKAGPPTAATAPAHKAEPQQSPAEAGPALATFSLVLKSISQLGWGLEDLGKAADEAGLVWSSVRTPESDKHIPGELKACPIAAFEYGRSMRFSLGERQHEVRLRMALQVGSPQPNALHLMRRSAAKLAQYLGAQVQLEDGTPVDDESIKPAEKWVRAVHTVRRQAARKLIDLPDGRKKELDEVAPWQAVIEGPGSRVEWVRFEPEAMEYYTGVVRGNELMLAALNNLKARTEPNRYGLRLGEAIAEALGLDWRKAVKYSRGKSKANVAVGMLEVVEEAVLFFARNANYEKWLQRQIESHRNTGEHMAAAAAVEREQRSVRAKIAHAKKREAARAQAAVPLTKKITKAATPATGAGGRRVQRAAAKAVTA